MATIRKRTGKRGITYQVQVRLVDRSSVSKTFPSRAGAVDWARKTEAKVLRDRYGTSDRRPLRHVLERYSEEVMPTKAASTRSGQKHLLVWWFNNYGDHRLSRMTPQLLGQIREDLEKQASGPTANRYLGLISHVFTVASREWGWMADNPMRRVRRCRESQPRVRFLSPKETKDLLKACKEEDPALHTVVVMALTTGMRRGEILGLCWKDVDLERRLIVLHQTKNRERRDIPISDALFDELRKLPRHVDTDLLFPGPRKRQQPRLFRAAFENAVEAAGLEDFRFHDLRHTVASYLAMNGATERDIAEVLGHKTMALVKRYTHLSKDYLEGLLNQVSTALVLHD